MIRMCAMAVVWGVDLHNMWMEERCRWRENPHVDCGVRGECGALPDTEISATA